MIPGKVYATYPLEGNSYEEFHKNLLEIPIGSFVQLDTFFKYVQDNPTTVNLLVLLPIKKIKFISLNNIGIVSTVTMQDGNYVGISQIGKVELTYNKDPGKDVTNTFYNPIWAIESNSELSIKCAILITGSENY